MLRDLNFFRRNGGKKPQLEEIENVPPTKLSSSLIQVGVAKFVARDPLNTIQEPIQNPKSPDKQEVGVKNKIDTTPTKLQGRGGNASNASSKLGTPEKQLGLSSRNKFGWAHKNETETRGDEGKSDVNHLPPSSRATGLGYGGLANMTPRSVRSVGRTTIANSECSSTHSTPTKSVTKPPNPGVSSRPPMNMGSRAANISAQAKGLPLSCASPSVVNTVEVPHFDLKEDPSFWMDHNVQVLIRVRPPNSMERSSYGYNRCLKQESAQTITWIGQPESRFTFDHVACETVNQEMLFRVAGLPMVENCLSGYNSCMFAYGQTGSGKTYTMLGEINELEFKPCPDRGMTPRIFEFLFARIRAEEESRRDEKLKYNCKCSFLEIYNEQIADLLDPSSTNLLLREDIKNGVYVENLTEYEVQSVNDILKLLTEGAANRKVAATNMNRESSRSHSVFTCVIESRWEKDSTTNLRFARLNLVDLAGSERQKTSGAEGERLKEAANINKSLSTLGHVIMLLVDVAHGKLRHIPYRDSRLTFLLQESLGGNSKTMIIANVSPSICCAAETLSTLKFAQRAKLIQNNAIINEDASGDVSALQQQIQMLKEELSIFKRRNVSRSLSFRLTALEDADWEGQHDTTTETSEMAHVSPDVAHERSTPSCIVRVSTKQLKSLEATLAGALRREQTADNSIKQLEAEIGQLNRLVNQREEDTRCTKMMLRFREDKIQRMESLLGGSMPTNAYLLEENNALVEELQLLRAKIDRNPEVTRFALENIRLLDKLRRFQEFYEEGEREMLLEEVSELRNQLLHFLDGNNEQYNCLNSDTPYELRKTNEELDKCRNNLNSCMEINSNLTREINDLHCQLDALKSLHHGQDANVNPILEPLIEVQAFESQNLQEAVHTEKVEWEVAMKHTEEIMNLQLELDILKAILQEERSYRGEVEERALSLSTDLDIAKARYLEISMHCKDMEEKLNNSKSVIEALESQQILMIDELEGLRDSNNHYLELLSKQEHEASALKKNCFQELRNLSSLEHTECKESNLQFKLKRMQDSLDMAKRLNTWYQSDQAFQTSHEQEMDEVRRQVEAETAEVILCLQEELTTLQQQVNDCNAKEIESKESLLLFETELKDLKERLGMMTQDNKRLSELVQEKDEELKTLSKDWETLASEIEEVIADGHVALKDASDQVNLITSSFPPSNWIHEQVGRLLRNITGKESLIEELQRSLEEAQNISVDMDQKLRSLKGAALAMTELQQQESSEKEKAILQLTSQLSEKTSIIKELEKKVKVRDDHLTRAESCATVAFVIVNRMSEIASDYHDVLKQKNTQLNETISLNLKKDDLLKDRDATIDGAEKQIRALRRELEASEESCVMLKKKLSEEEEHAQLLEIKLADTEKDILLKTRENLDDQFTSAETCATVAFVIVNKSSEIISDYCDVLKQKDTQLNEAISLNLKKDIVIEDQVAAIDGAEEQIQALRGELEVSKESCVMVKQKLFEEEEHAHLLERKLECIEKDIFLKTRENLDDHFISAETCATMAFVVGDKLYEITSYYRDVLKQKDTQLNEAISLNLKKEDLLEDQVAAIDRAEKQIQALRRELEVSEERYVVVKQKLSEEEKHVHLMERKLDVEKDILLKTKEKLDEFKLEVSTLNLCMNEYANQINGAERIQTLGKNIPNYLGDNSEGQIVIEKNEDISKKESQAIEGLKNDRTKTSFKSGKDVKDIPCEMESLSIRSTCEDAYDKDLTILLLRNEIESALVSLKQVQAQMIKLFEEKEEISNSEKQNKRSLECFTTQLLALQSEICDSEEQLKLKIMELEHKILKLEESTQEAKIIWLQKEEVFDLELSDAKVVAMQKTAEVGSLLVKFEEVQETMKEADVIINALVIANDTSKVKIDRLKEMLVKVTNERDFINNEVQILHLSNNKKDQLYASLEKQFLSDLSDTGNLVFSLEDTIKEVKASLEEQIESILGDFHCFKAQILDSTCLTRSWLEDIWSEIIVKDCAVSVLHLCHMGVLLEAVNGLNAENGLLQYGLCESNSVIIDLKEHNLKATKELEMFGTTKGKLLLDIKDSFNRIIRKENEAIQLGSKLSSFEKKILDLQFQEELMLARSNSIGSELSHLMGELDTHNTNTFAALSNQINFLKDQEELTHLQVEFLTVDLTAKEFESLILASELLHTGLQKADLERVQEKFIAFLEDLRKELIFLNIETDMKKQLLMDTVVEVSLLKEVVSSNVNCCVDSFGVVDNTQTRMFQLLDGKNISLLEKMFNEICENREMASNLIQECECLEYFIEQLTSENLSFQSELSRKDEVLKGMLFDLSLLQESASNAKDQKDDVEEMAAAYESLEDDLALMSAQLDEAFVQNQMLEAQLQEKLNSISALELDLSKKCKSLKLVMDENVELTTQLEDVLHVKGSIEEELKERHNVLERLEEENIQMNSALGQMNTLLEGLKNDLNRVTGDRNRLSSEIHVLKEKLEMTEALAEENEARANEAQQIADTRKMYAEDKEEEVKLLERSVEELESTVNVLEDKVDIVKGEAERQRLLREELETELLVIRNQMITVTTPGTTLDVAKNNIFSGDVELQSRLEEKDRDLQKTREQIAVLEKSIAEKDAEISQCREHISELNLHAEAQGYEYKQKFKILEAMAEQVKPDPMPSHGTNSSSSKLEKNATKSRGSGSPFKCIGLGLSQQIKSEKDEELTAGRLHIEELEALVASRQKEIFLLNARLAAAESMTHDVIRDLLGVKLDMNNYASLLDHQQVHRITQKAQVNREESLVKEQELITKLKQQLNEFVEERQGWLEELSRRQAEMVAAQIASEKLGQREQFLTTENDMLKKENMSHKKKAMELEDEVKKLSGQQNLQQRIHHHAKIKEENNLLKSQNEDLRHKLRRMETILSRLKEEAASYRAPNGRIPFVDFDEERLLNNKLKETEEEKFQLTQKLLYLCTSILKAAGITCTAQDISLSTAEEALEVLKERISYLERESQDLKFKNKLCNEMARLSEIKQQSSLSSSKTNENCTTPERTFQSPFFTALDR